MEHGTWSTSKIHTCTNASMKASNQHTNHRHRDGLALWPKWPSTFPKPVSFLSMVHVLYVHITATQLAFQLIPIIHLTGVNLTGWFHITFLDWAQPGYLGGSVDANQWTSPPGMDQEIGLSNTNVGSKHFLVHFMGSLGLLLIWPLPLYLFTMFVCFFVQVLYMHLFPRVISHWSI